MANLGDIRLKVRRLTRSPAEAQLTTAQLDDYVNTFVLYDFPENLRLFSLRTTFKFYTEPYRDVYDSDNFFDELNDFKNRYITVHEPVYIDGRKAQLFQSRDQFYGLYPKITSNVNIGVGDGANMAFAGTLTNFPVLMDNVLFSSVSNFNTKIELHDIPGAIFPLGDLEGNGSGTIQYNNGIYNILFSLPPAAGVNIVAHTVPYVPSRPWNILFFDNKFVVRPIPDQAYTVEMEVYKRPTALLAVNQEPELEQWWAYISYGAAIKILQDRLDEDTVRMLMPEFKQQERLVLRKTIVQNSNSRVATIYTDRLDGPSRAWWNNRR